VNKLGCGGSSVRDSAYMVCRERQVQSTPYDMLPNWELWMRFGAREDVDRLEEIEKDESAERSNAVLTVLKIVPPSLLASAKYERQDGYFERYACAYTHLVIQTHCI
jgi:hypothetical protein